MDGWVEETTKKNNNKTQSLKTFTMLDHAWPSFAELRRNAFSDMDQADGKGEEGKT